MVEFAMTHLRLAKGREWQRHIRTVQNRGLQISRQKRNKQQNLLRCANEWKCVRVGPKNLVKFLKRKK